MEFFKRQTYYDYNRDMGMSADALFKYINVNVSQFGLEDEYTRVQLMLEHMWIQDKRPYYNVYPAIARMLLNTKLALDCCHVKAPLRVVLLRFPVDAPLAVGKIDRKLRSILIGFFDEVETIRGRLGGRGFGVWCDRGEMLGGVPAFDYQTVLLKDGMSIEDSIASYTDHQNSDDPDALYDALRVSVGVCLLAQDSDYVIPDVLDKDKGKPITDALVDKAHRRGKVGWNVGKDVECVPHFRNSHFAIRHTGKGGLVPRLVPIKGSIVHRDVVTKVPTGLLDEEVKQEV